MAVTSECIRHLPIETGDSRLFPAQKIPFFQCLHVHRSLVSLGIAWYQVIWTVLAPIMVMAKPKHLGAMAPPEWRVRLKH
jgi:hypothetical protein